MNVRVLLVNLIANLSQVLQRKHEMLRSNLAADGNKAKKIGHRPRLNAERGVSQHQLPAIQHLRSHGRRHRPDEAETEPKKKHKKQDLN